jgi:hypothetical protein
MGNPVASSLTLDANNTIWTSYNEGKFRQKKIAINAQQGAPDWSPFTLETTTTNEFRTVLWGTKYLRRQRHYFDIKSALYPGVNAEIEVDTIHALGSVTYIATGVDKSFAFSDPADCRDFCLHVEQLLRDSLVPSDEVDAFCQFFPFFLNKVVETR